MLDINDDGHINYVDLDQQEPPISGDEFNQYYTGNNAEHERDLKEDERGMRFDDFQEDGEEEFITMDDQNKHALTETKQEEQGAYFLSIFTFYWSVHAFCIAEELKL